MEEIKIPADITQLDEVIQFIDGQLDKIECSMKTRMQIDVAVEELFVNIAHYAYPAGEGIAIIRFSFECETNTITICFLDNGVPYDPLAKEDPDTSLSSQERSIGGLGIFLVKKTMDDVIYEYRDEQNILIIQKYIPQL